MKSCLICVRNNGEKQVYTTITCFLEQNPKFAECKSAIYESISRKKEKYVNFYFTLEKAPLITNKR